MAIWAALIGVLGGGILNKQAANERKKGNQGAQVDINAAAARARQDLGPYSSIGRDGLYKLANLSGIAGYGSPEEIELTNLQEPTLESSIANIDKSDLEKYLSKSPSTRLGIGGGGLKYKSLRKGRKKAMAAQQTAMDAANKKKYQDDLAKYRTKKAELEGIVAQQRSSGTLKTGYDALAQTPAYKFRQQQGEKSLSALGSQQGDLLSGQNLKRLTEFGQGLASQEYGNEFNRLLSLSGIGQNAATTQANTSIGAGSNLANLSVNAGEIGANKFSNYNDLLQGGLENYTYLNRLKNNTTDTGSSYGGNTYASAGDADIFKNQDNIFK